MQRIMTKDDFVLALASPADANVTTASRPWRQVYSSSTGLPLLSRQCLAGCSYTASKPGGRCMPAGSEGSLCCPALCSIMFGGWQLSRAFLMQ